MSVDLDCFVDFDNVDYPSLQVKTQPALSHSLHGKFVAMGVVFKAVSSKQTR